MEQYGDVARYLLLPSDEREFVEWAEEECGLRLLHSDVLVNGRPSLAGTAALPPELPPPVQPHEPSRIVRELLLWHPDWGVNDLEPWESGSALQRVAARLTLEAAQDAGVAVGDLIDSGQTRLLQLRRCGWMPDGRLHVAALGGSARPVKQQHDDVMRILRRAERWLRRGAVRVELSAGTRYRPQIHARPNAAAWVAAGGVVYPWDA